jgi:predicted RNase H-like HicB family nuclease
MPHYLGIVDRGADGAFGAVFPDLPGCATMGKDLDELYAGGIEAVRLWAESALDEGQPIPPPRGNADLMADPEVRAMLKNARHDNMLIVVPMLVDRGRPVRANLSIDADLLGEIDVAAKARGQTRSAFLVQAARTRIERGE